MHCKAGAATALLYNLYQKLTKRQVRVFQPHEPEIVPAFARPTASRILKDNEIHRIEDDLQRTLVSIDVLGMYHEQRRMTRAMEGPMLVQRGRRDQDASKAAAAEVKERELEGAEATKVDEVQVKSLQR